MKAINLCVAKERYYVKNRFDSSLIRSQERCTRLKAADLKRGRTFFQKYLCHFNPLRQYASLPDMCRTLTHTCSLCSAVGGYIRSSCHLKVVIPMKSLIKIFSSETKPLPRFHPESGEFWSLLSAVHGWSEGVELVFDGSLTPGPLHFLCGILTGEQELEWRRLNKERDDSLKRQRQRQRQRQRLNKRLGSLSRPNSELPWYHPNNDYFWGQIDDVRISAEETVLVFLGSALHDDFRLWLRQRQDTVRTPGGDFLLTSGDLADSREKWYSPREAAAMFNFWASHHPEIVDQADWREYICEQARIDREFARNKEQLKNSIDEAFPST